MQRITVTTRSFAGFFFENAETNTDFGQIYKS
jgi:hypothetical protein